MSTQHTPGPWQIVRNSCSMGISNSVGKWRLADGIPIPSVPMEEHEANARLIAAAPDLLEALQACRAEFVRIGHRNNSGLVLMVDNAISKAGGAR